MQKKMIAQLVTVVSPEFIQALYEEAQNQKRCG